MPDFTVRLYAARPWRRWLRPSVTIGGDYMLPDAAPLPLAQGLLAAEMAMNLQMALGQRRYLLLHAAAVERDGRALLMTGESGAGKSTLAALLRGARLAAAWATSSRCSIPTTGLVHAFPRLVSLKNDGDRRGRSAAWPDARFGPLLAGTPKGDIRHLVPDAARDRARWTSPRRPRCCCSRASASRPTTRAVGAERGVRAADAGVDQLCRAGRARVRAR